MIDELPRLEIHKVSSAAQAFKPLKEVSPNHRI
jgi:hypothetical protein